jgi:D-alanyl-D-alanine carboxypeptidase (penicillin-binding protein 5/6)
VLKKNKAQWLKMNNILLPFLSLLILTAAVFPSAAFAAEEEVNIKGASSMLTEARSGATLYAKDAAKKCYPASVTKIMTLVLALEAVEEGRASLTDIITVSDEAASMGGSQVYLYSGEQRTLHEMLIAVAVGSGNDASVAVAEFIGGSLKTFVEMMNSKAASIGMKNSNFVNPHGLHDENHYTTAADLALLAAYSLKTPHLLEYTSIYEYDFRPEPKPLKLWNGNRLLKWYDGCDGIKTGYTSEAGRNLVSSAERDGLRLIAVVLGVEEAKGHFTESMKLLNYGFNKYSYKLLYQKGNILGVCPVEKGSTAEVGLKLSEDAGFLAEKGAKEEIKSGLKIPAAVYAPITKGQTIGELILEKNGAIISRLPLEAAADIPRIGFLKLWFKIMCSATVN